MKRENFLSVFGAALFLMATALFIFPKPVQAQEDTKQWVSTTCEVNGGTSWKCNNCDAGTKECNDNSCFTCMPAS